MTNATIKAVLQLTSGDDDECPIVELGSAPNPGKKYLKGIMSYKGENIDTIEADFYRAPPGQLIAVQINLTDDDNEFTLEMDGSRFLNYATADVAGQIMLSDITVVYESPTTLNLIFTEPEVGQTSGHCPIYFHTLHGTIDPDWEDEREPN
ncbi:MAG: hypothetical protein KTR16_14300 [Acidiferrobacterales bacterium]|nr:hypothetical protein [Acidiferrobacterales bacterium]